MTLEEYIEKQVLPLYDAFDPAHQRNHAHMVIERSLALATHYPQVRSEVILAAAAFHDVGLCEGREMHHMASGQIVRSTPQLHEWFNPEEIETIAQAAEDHRASSSSKPRSLVGCIVAEADRLIDPHTIVTRCIQYGLSHYPHLSREAHYERMRSHILSKYGEGGYLHLLLPESPNAQALQELRSMLRDEEALKAMFTPIFNQLTK